MSLHKMVISLILVSGISVSLAYAKTFPGPFYTREVQFQTPAFLKQSVVLFGDPVSKDDQARKYTVYLETFGEDGKINGDCSGVLIEERTVLTAAHCLEDDVANVRVTFGNLSKKGGPDLKLYAERFERHPHYDTAIEQSEALSNSVTRVSIAADFINTDDISEREKILFESQRESYGYDRESGEVDYDIFNSKVDVLDLLDEQVGLATYYDLGLIKLSSKAPSPYEPVKFAPPEVGIFPAMDIYIFGYGRSTANHSKPGLGVLRSTTLMLSTGYLVDDTLAVFGAIPMKLQGACYADSGGPAMVKDPRDGSMYLIGIIAGGMGCLGEAFITMPNMHIPWIEETVSRFYSGSKEI